MRAGDSLEARTVASEGVIFLLAEADSSTLGTQSRQFYLMFSPEAAGLSYLPLYNHHPSALLHYGALKRLRYNVVLFILCVP